MKILNIIDEDFINYRNISMFIAMPYCSGKCWKELGLDCSICQNDELRKSPIIDIKAIDIIERYTNNLLSEAIVFGGMEPFDSEDDLKYFIMGFREISQDIIIIYTGYTEEEVRNKFKWVFKYINIIIKVGRYIPNQEKRYDGLLGVWLASPNQYSIKTSLT